MFPKTVKLCGRWDVRVNSLWLWWYCGAAIAMETYLLYRAVLRCQRYNELPWNAAPEKPVTELYSYIALIVLSIMCQPFLIITSLFKVGNYANDGTRLGRDVAVHRQELMLHRQDGGERNSIASSTESSNASSASALQRQRRDQPQTPSGWRMVWQHSGPLCHGFHILAAFCLMLPAPILQAREIQYGFQTPGKFCFLKWPLIHPYAIYYSAIFSCFLSCCTIVLKYIIFYFMKLRIEKVRFKSGKIKLYFTCYEQEDFFITNNKISLLGQSSPLTVFSISNMKNNTTPIVFVDILIN